MAEPTTPVTIAALSAVSLFPFINGNALLGAVLGAAFIATFEKDLNALLGYLPNFPLKHRKSHYMNDEAYRGPDI